MNYGITSISGSYANSLINQFNADTDDVILFLRCINKGYIGIWNVL